jgi:hypothetical protein
MEYPNTRQEHTFWKGWRYWCASCCEIKAPWLSNFSFPRKIRQWAQISGLSQLLSPLNLLAKSRVHQTSQEPACKYTSCNKCKRFLDAWLLILVAVHHSCWIDSRLFINLIYEVIFRQKSTDKNAETLIWIVSQSLASTEVSRRVRAEKNMFRAMGTERSFVTLRWNFHYNIHNSM